MGDGQLAASPTVYVAACGTHHLRLFHAYVTRLVNEYCRRSWRPGLAAAALSGSIHHFDGLLGREINHPMIELGVWRWGGLADSICNMRLCSDSEVPHVRIGQVKSRCVMRRTRTGCVVDACWR